MASPYEVADFYKQLALLTKAGLPLPETLRSLADAAETKRFKAALLKLGEETAKGRSLADAMKEMPELFPPFFSGMAGAGERCGALPAALSELAALARANYMLAALVRDIMLYPLITILIALMALGLLSCLVLPIFSDMYDNLFGGSRLPFLTTAVFWIASTIREFFPFFATAFLAFASFCVWLMIGKGRAKSMLLSLIRLAPLSEMIFYNMEMSRVCALWSAMMKQKTPDSEALLAISELAELPQVGKALRNASEACAKGLPAAKALEAEPCVSRLLCLSLDGLREACLPEELEKLSELFMERSRYGFRRVALAWELIAVCGMAFCVGAVAFFLFLPLISRILSDW